MLRVLKAAAEAFGWTPGLHHAVVAHIHASPLDNVPPGDELDAGFDFSFAGSALAFVQGRGRTVAFDRFLERRQQLVVLGPCADGHTQASGQWAGLVEIANQDIAGDAFIAGIMAQIDALRTELNVPEDEWARFAPDSGAGRLCAAAARRLFRQVGHQQQVGKSNSRRTGRSAPWVRTATSPRRASR